MTDEQLLKIIAEGGEISVPYFDGGLISVMEEDYVPQEDAVVALKNFLKLTNDQRLRDAQHLLAYCKMMMEAVGEEEILEDVGGVHPSLDTIWKFAKIRHIFFAKLDQGKYASTPTVYVQIEGEVTWEPEHGLQMSWEEGYRLVKAGPFDGHPTNGHAYADPKKDQHVFSCYNPNLCTLPDSEE